MRCLDIVPPPANAWRHERIKYVTGDVCDEATLDALVEGADCVWHNAAAVGPFHPRELYFKVNYEGSLNVVRACRKAGVPKIVMSSSPSTRWRHGREMAERWPRDSREIAERGPRDCRARCS